MSDYIYIPLVVNKNGFKYTQVCRGRRTCIYVQYVSPKIKYYEVFLIKQKPERRLFGKVVPPKEAFPSNEDFGYSAWTFRDYVAALWRFHELEQGKSMLEFIRSQTNEKIYNE